MGWFRRLPFQSITPSHFCTDVQHYCALNLKVSRLVEPIHMKEKTKTNEFSFFLEESVSHSCSLVHGCSACCTSRRAEWVEILTAETGKHRKLLNQNVESRVAYVKPQPRFDQVPQTRCGLLQISTSVILILRAQTSFSSVCGKQPCKFVGSISVHVELQKSSLAAWY